MDLKLRLLILMLGISMVGLDIYLLQRHKIGKKFSLVLISGLFFTVIFSVFPKFIDVIAVWIGIEYPPALFFLIVIWVLLVMTIFQSVQIQKLQIEVKELTQFVVLENDKANETNKSRRDK